MLLQPERTNPQCRETANIKEKGTASKWETKNTGGTVPLNTHLNEYYRFSRHLSNLLQI